ncbi:hypothetical protein ARMGADRAFT_1116153 [Armillaria gallica]|uniref:Uncharacterized protein n=1 Tax=Armillaria gallica TaxID=47427 RepID=A0A2H3E207_ARMGA|nr:hypothetical protein ARMGADRAFT_1116153 [Armillaria gallica]
MTKGAGKVAHPPKLINTLPWQISALPWVPWAQGDYDDDYKDFSDDPLWSLNILGKAPSNTMPVMIASDDLESVTRINDSGLLSCSTRVETETREKDKELHARFQRKVPKLKAEVKTKDEVPVEASARRLPRLKSGLVRSRFESLKLAMQSKNSKN